VAPLPGQSKGGGAQAMLLPVPQAPPRLSPHRHNLSGFLTPTKEETGALTTQTGKKPRFPVFGTADANV
jgi:hypothetical protein